MKYIGAGTRFFYSVVLVNLVRFFFIAVSLFDGKTRRGLRGRRNLFANLKEKMATVPPGKRIWFHASSLGEFEQAKPIIEILAEKGFRIIVSFFSPSGFEHSQGYSHADAITYIPIDSEKNAREFIRIVNPSVAVMMRYDLWMNHLLSAKRAGAKIVIADATFPVKILRQPVPLRRFFQKLYGLTDYILTTNDEHKKLFDAFLGEEKTVSVGDTRFDRVYEKSLRNDILKKLPLAIDRSGKTVMILGSTWPEDMDVLHDGLTKISESNPKLLVIVVPHEPSPEEVSRLTGRFPNAKVLSSLDGHKEDISFLIIDSVGLLTQLYLIGDIAYVGGGFGAGVHSVLEPAVYGIPIITGPRIERSDEAVQLMHDGALTFVSDAEQAYAAISRAVNNEPERKKAGAIAKAFVERHIGASAAVASRIEQASSNK